MAARRKLVISTSDGWEGGNQREILLQPDQTEYEFKMAPQREWVRATSVNDGPVFDVWVESTNSTGSRVETRHLVPEEVV